MGHKGAGSKELIADITHSYNPKLSQSKPRLGSLYFFQQNRILYYPHVVQARLATEGRSFEIICVGMTETRPSTFLGLDCPIFEKCIAWQWSFVPTVTRTLQSECLLVCASLPKPAPPNLTRRVQQWLKCNQTREAGLLSGAENKSLLASAEYGLHLFSKAKHVDRPVHFYGIAVKVMNNAGSLHKLRIVT